MLVLLYRASHSQYHTIVITIPHTNNDLSFHDIHVLMTRGGTLLSFLVGGVLLKLRALGADRGGGGGPLKRAGQGGVVGRVFLRVLEVCL